MRLARYTTTGSVEIAVCAEPVPRPGGIIVRTLASGLCSGELMHWYMQGKAPHVLGHEVSGLVAESDSPAFPIGSLVAPHHHAACGDCAECAAGREVACAQWGPSRLEPGGMAERFFVPKEALPECHRCDGLDPVDAALVEPVACVVKSLERGAREGPAAVVGLGALGIVHMLLSPGSVGYEVSPARRARAEALGLEARSPEQAEPARRWFVCPGSAAALSFALSHLMHDASVVLFAPMPPGGDTPVDLHASYFLDARLVTSYSCGPSHTAQALAHIRAGTVRAHHLVDSFVTLDGLPRAYEEMSAGKILKAMVVFP